MKTTFHFSEIKCQFLERQTYLTPAYSGTISDASNVIFIHEQLLWWVDADFADRPVTLQTVQLTS